MSRPILTAIVAMTPERVIGRDGTLPWHLPEDLAFFKKTTLGHPIVMGRKTFESIGRPLPKRRNIVITRDPAWHADGVEVIHHPEDLASLPDLGPRVFIIGGAEIYQAFLPMLDDLIISHVQENHPGDTWFPEFQDRFPNSEILESFPDFVVRRWWVGLGMVAKNNLGKASQKARDSDIKNLYETFLCWRLT